MHKKIMAAMANRPAPAWVSRIERDAIFSDCAEGPRCTFKVRSAQWRRLERILAAKVVDFHISLAKLHTMIGGWNRPCLTSGVEQKYGRSS